MILASPEKSRVSVFVWKGSGTARLQAGRGQCQVSSVVQTPVMQERKIVSEAHSPLNMTVNAGIKSIDSFHSSNQLQDGVFKGRGCKERGCCQYCLRAV